MNDKKLEYGFYVFSIDYYNSFEEKEVPAHGVVYADTYETAIKRITADYGETDINKISLYALEPFHTLPLSKKICDNIKEGIYERY